jgi:acetylornithine deacetylase/succinyl-diaminopimelate desuccinylase-like protein
LLLLLLLLLLLQAGTVSINFRLLPGDTSDTIHQQLLRWLGADAQHANITFTDKWETPAAVTDPEGPHFALVKAAIREAWQLNRQSSKGQSPKGARHDQPQTAAAAAGANVGNKQQQQQQQQHAQDDHVMNPPAGSAAGLLPVIPYLLCGGTDSKWYANLTSNIIRFAPFSVNRRAGDVKRVHGTDERLSVGDFGRMLCTFRAGMRLAGMHMHLGSAAAAAAAAAAQQVPAERGSSVHSSTFDVDEL